MELFSLGTVNRRRARTPSVYCESYSISHDVHEYTCTVLSLNIAADIPPIALWRIVFHWIQENRTYSCPCVEYIELTIELCR